MVVEITEMTYIEIPSQSAKYVLIRCMQVCSTAVDVIGKPVHLVIPYKMDEKYVQMLGKLALIVSNLDTNLANAAAYAQARKAKRGQSSNQGPASNSAFTRQDPSAAVDEVDKMDAALAKLLIDEIQKEDKKE